MIAGTHANTANVARPGSFGRLQEVYRATIVERGRSEGFLIAIAFLVTSLMVRGITHAIKDQRFTFLFHNMSSGGGMHIHHFVYGILALLVVGFVSIRFHPDGLWSRRALAIGYGIAAALTLDEFAIWLRLADVYWSPQGRESVYALVLAGAVFFVGLEGIGFWRAILRDLAWLLRHRDGEYPRL
jgi:hypothetical protein